MALIRRGLWFAFALGVGLFVILLAVHGFRDIFAAVRKLGPAALCVPAFFLLPAFLATWSWMELFPPKARPAFLASLAANWICFGINWLLPVAGIGGDVAKAHYMTDRGASGNHAVAATVVDKTLQLATQVLFALIGAAVFALLVARSDLLTFALAGTAVLAVLSLLFFRAQQRGLFRSLLPLGRRFLSASRSDSLERGTARLDSSVMEVYARRGPLWRASALRMLFRVVLAGETFLILKLLGRDPSWTEVLVIESLAQAARAGAFWIPGALGAQEGAIVAIGWALGISGPDAMALALAKRWRELVIGVPAIVAWHVRFGLRMFFRKPSSPRNPPGPAKT